MFTPTIKQQAKPELCCTCGNWRPYKDNIESGTCIPALMSTDFDGNCSDWQDHENKRSSKLHIQIPV